MQPDPRFFDNRGAIRPPQQSSVWRYWPLMLLVVIPVFFFMCCGCSVVGYMLIGIQTTSDPVQVRAGLDGMTDMQLPAGLQPHLKMLQITGVDKVDFRSGSGGSFMSLTTGERFPLQHPGTLREASDRGKTAAGGRPESPAEQRAIIATVRGKRAEFICRRYADTETVSGFFQGKKYPVHLEAELSLQDFPPGTAAALAESIR